MTSEPLVSAIIVNWNGAKHLQVCIPSLLKQSYQSLEIVVVDNGSSDESAAVVAAAGVGWFPLEENVGLARALDRGAERASGDFLLFLNNDMRFDAEFVGAMVAQMVADPDVFSVDAVQYDWDGKRKVHVATSLASKAAGELDEQLVPGLYACQTADSRPRLVLMSSAANMLVRKSMFLQLGGFDERLPLGYEDVELCWRAWVRGWKTSFAPAAVCWHRVGASQRIGEGARLSFRGILGGRLLLATKLLPARFVLKTLLVSFGGLLRDVACLRWQQAQDRISVFADYLCRVPQLLQDRHQIYRVAERSPREQVERFFQMRTDII